MLFTPGCEFRVTSVHPRDPAAGGASLKLIGGAPAVGFAAMFGGTDAIGITNDGGAVALDDRAPPSGVTVIEMDQIK